MVIRASQFSMAIVAALVACGCGSGSTYNIPTDAAKEALEKEAATALKNVPAGQQKVTKPPGPGALKDFKGLKRPGR